MLAISIISNRYRPLTVIGVEFTEVDICGDTIKTALKPTGVSGTFTLRLIGESTVTLIDNENRAGGDYDDSFNVRNLPDNMQFTRLEATWTVNSTPCTKVYDYSFKVLQDYRITCYNTPLETDFTGGTTAVNVCDVDCNWSTQNFNTAFLNEVVENGNGITSAGEIIVLEWWCQTHGYPPPPDPPAFDGAYYFRVPGTITGACGGGLTVGGSGAINPGNPDLSCGDRVYIEDTGCISIDDHGGGLSNTQIDLYNGQGNVACSGWPNPSRKVVKIP